MNVLFAADYSTPKSGNFIASLLELANELRSEGGNAVFLLKKANPEKSPWINWLRTRGYDVLGLDQDMPILEQFEKIVRDYSIDIIHVHFGLYTGLLAKNAEHFPSTRIIIHDHMEFTDLDHPVKQKIVQLIHSVYYRLKGVYTISANQRKNRYYAFCRHWFVPNGLSMLRNLNPDADEQLIAPNYWNEPRIEGEKRCLFLGWHPQWKGLDIAIRAVDIVRKRGINLILCVIGFGNGMSKQNQNYLESNTGIPVDSPFIKLLKSEEDMFSVLRSMDVFLSASRSEAFSYGLLEAISQNVPVVVSDIEGTKWSSAYNKSFFYPVESPEACADALEKAISCNVLISNASDLVSKYSIDHWIASLLKIYKVSIKRS